MFDKKLIALAAAGAATLVAGAASAQNVVVSSDVRLLQGPGADYAVVSQLPSNSTVVVDGCLQGGQWCSLTSNGVTGWVPADQVTVNGPSGSYVLAQPPKTTTYRTIEYDDAKQARNGSAGLLAGAAAGAAVAGPVGAAVGAVVGGASGVAVTPPDERVTTYVQQNPLQPVVVQQPMTVGAVVPSNVTLTPVPDSQLSYIYVDGSPVLVDNHNRTVVRVVN